MFFSFSFSCRRKKFCRLVGFSRTHYSSMAAPFKRWLVWFKLSILSPTIWITLTTPITRKHTTTTLRPQFSFPEPTFQTLCWTNNVARSKPTRLHNQPTHHNSQPTWIHTQPTQAHTKSTHLQTTCSIPGANSATTSVARGPPVCRMVRGEAFGARSNNPRGHGLRVWIGRRLQFYSAQWAMFSAQHFGFTRFLCL